MTIFIFVLLISVSGYANPSQEQLLRSVDSWLVEIQLKTKSKKNLCGADNTASSSLQKCAQSLCGPAGTGPSIYVTNESVTPLKLSDEERSDFESFRPKIVELLEKKRASDVAKILKIDRSLFDDLPAYVDSLEDNIFISLLQNLIEENISVSVIREEDGTRSIRTAIYENRKLMKSQQVSFALKRFLDYRKRRMRSSLLDALWYGYHTEEEFLEIFTAKSDELIAKITKMDGSPSQGNIAENIQKIKNTVAEFNERVESNQVTEDFVEETLYELKGIERAYRITDIFNTRAEFECPRNQCAGALIALIKNFDPKKKLNVIKDHLRDDSNFSQAAQGCESAWLAQSYHNRLEERFDVYESMRGEVLERFSNRALSKFSPETQLTFGAKLKQFQLKRPEKEFSNIQEFKDEVERSIEELSNQNSLVEGNELSFLREFLWGEEVESLPWVLEESCEALGALGRDSFRSSGFASSNEINYSSLSCTHPIYGADILAHELGHFLSYEFQKGSLSHESRNHFRGLRMCVDSQYKSPAYSNSPRDARGDLLYTEEDTADIFLYQMGSNRSALTSCALLKPNIETREYEELYLIDFAHKDNHSSTLLRVIREAIYKKKLLPPSCREVVAEYEEDFNFESCRLE